MQQARSKTCSSWSRTCRATAAAPSSQFHRSHQSGRDADLLYYMRDADGKPFEPDAMHVFDRTAVAKDGSGHHVDVPRTWLLVKELLTAPEAYRPVHLHVPSRSPSKLIDYAQAARRGPEGHRARDARR